MRETNSDVVRGTLNKDGITLEFGRLQGSQRKEGERTVDLSVGIDMPVMTAKRLMVVLAEAIQAHEKGSRFRRTTPQVNDGDIPVNAVPDPAAGKADLMLRLVAELGVPYQYERSFRISAESLLANRYLLSLNQVDIPGDRKSRVLEICSRLGMPPELQSAITEKFEMTTCLHFGFEADGDHIINKLYLERAVSELEAANARATCEPILLHIAFKWDVQKQAHVVTRYLWFPSLSAEEIESRLSGVYRRLGHGPALEIAKAVLRLATEKTPAERIQYLEVHEDENARWSFDLNLYTAGLHVTDIQAPLQRMREHFRVRPGQFQALYDQIKNKTLGHIAGGVHRTGDDFFNIYYGAAGFPHFAKRFS